MVGTYRAEKPLPQHRSVIGGFISLIILYAALVLISLSRVMVVSILSLPPRLVAAQGNDWINRVGP